MMSDGNFIDARKFMFKPFPHPLHPEDTGDSSALEFAASKIDQNEQYIIKKGGLFPEVACNEFIYHKVATALGLYTQEVKLISGNATFQTGFAQAGANNFFGGSLTSHDPKKYFTYFG